MEGSMQYWPNLALIAVAVVVALRVVIVMEIPTLVLHAVIDCMTDCSSGDVVICGYTRFSCIRSDLFFLALSRRDLQTRCIFSSIEEVLPSLPYHG